MQISEIKAKNIKRPTKLKNKDIFIKREHLNMHVSRAQKRNKETGKRQVRNNIELLEC